MGVRLFNPVTVTVERLFRTAPAGDALRREPIRGGRDYRAVTAPAQVVWDAGWNSGAVVRERSALGSDPGASGYCVFRTEDLRAADVYPLGLGDVLRVPGGQLPRYWVHKVQPAAQEGPAGESQLQLVWFHDRAPEER